MALEEGVHYSSQPPKEMRTMRREGSVVTEDYERLNADGTVTKTITTTDENTGKKEITIYKMDKSGIVRKVDDLDPKTWAETGKKKEDLLQHLKDKLSETKGRIQALKEQSEKENSKSVAYENRGPFYRNGYAYSKRVEEEQPDKHEMAYSLRNINKPIELTTKQQALLREHKENIINYGTQKLIKQLNKKLNDEKFNEAYPSMSDEQKDKVIEYGVRKFHRLLEKNLDDERLVYDLMSYDPEFGKVDLSGRGMRQIPGDQSVSFALNPYKDITQEDIAKPVSFSMRPEKPSKSLLEPEKSDDNRVNDGYNSLWRRLWKPANTTEKSEHTQKGYESSNSKLSDDAYDKYDSETAVEEQKEPNDFNKLQSTIKKLVQDDKYYKKSKLTPEQKEGVVDYALRQIRSVLKNSTDTDDEEKENLSRKKKIDVRDYFDEDEIFDFGKRQLRRLIRRNLKSFELDQDMLRKEKLDDPEDNARRNAFFQYLEDIIEGRVKDSDLFPSKPKKLKQKEELEDESNNWDFQSVLSSVFGKDKNKEEKEKLKDQGTSGKDFDSLYPWVKSDKKGSIGKEKVSNETSENAQKVKPHFYQLDPQKNEQNQNESESKRFDLKSLLQKIQQAAVRKFSEPKPQSENIDNMNKGSTQYQEYAQMNTNNNINQEKELKQAEIDAALNRIKQNNNEVSNTKRVKPPYFKERISGLDSIPIPTITHASPVERQTNYNDQVSFQLKPQGYEINNKQGDNSRSLENQRIETAKPCSHEQDFQPWWFESPDSFVKKSFTGKPLIKDSFIDPPMIKTSFSTGGNEFSSGGSFSSDNLLH